MDWTALPLRSINAQIKIQGESRRGREEKRNKLRIGTKSKGRLDFSRNFRNELFQFASGTWVCQHKANGIKLWDIPE